jgi:hypothetical protein
MQEKIQKEARERRYNLRDGDLVVRFYETESKGAALYFENKLIRLHKPPLNIDGVDDPTDSEDGEGPVEVFSDDSDGEEMGEAVVAREEARAVVDERAPGRHEHRAPVAGREMEHEGSDDYGDSEDDIDSDS